jgi:hypothetical protein
MLACPQGGTTISALTIDQRHAGSVGTAFADSLQITVQELAVSNLEAFLDYLGGILIRAVLGSEAKDVVNSTAAVSRSSMFADVLNAPVSELTVGDDIDASEDFVDARPLGKVSVLSYTRKKIDIPCLLQDSSQRYSALPDCQSRREQLRATCREEPR